MKFLGSKTGLKAEILAKLAHGPPYRFYANETNMVDCRTTNLGLDEFGLSIYCSFGKCFENVVSWLNFSGSKFF